MLHGDRFDRATPPPASDSRWKRRRIAVCVAGLAVVGGWGCGGGMPNASSSTAEASVKGTVKVRGKPATKGTLVFDPANINRPDVGSREAPIQPDGSYEIKAVVGGNSVRITGPLIAKEPSLEYQSRPVEVQAGENTIHLDFLAD